MDDTSFTQSFDGREWARAFVATVKEHPDIPTDEATMHGWFANAIMRGYDEHARKIVPAALESVIAERERQDAKWGEQNHDPFTYLTILMEEVGELSQAALHARFEGGPKGTPEHVRDEAVQVAAVALAIVECLDRRKWRWPKIATDGA